MKKEQDLRFIRTRQMIKAAFFELIDSIGFDKITIQNLSEKAMINRSTFYLHYTDKYDLLDKIEDEMLGEIKGIITVMPLETFGLQPFDTDKGYEIIAQVYTYIQETEAFLSTRFCIAARSLANLPILSKRCSEAKSSCMKNWTCLNIICYPLQQERISLLSRSGLYAKHQNHRRKWRGLS